MDGTATTLSHEEISLLLFALQGGSVSPMPDAESCEEACPVVESIEDLLCGGKIEPEQQLVRHLNNHVREGLIESGLFELMASARNGDDQPPAVDLQSKLNIANERLKHWRSDVKFSGEERRLLTDALRRIPRSAWVMMPRTLWRLRKKLKPREHPVIAG